MTIQSFDFPPPENETDFESFCLAIFRLQLGILDLQKYARRGQVQQGIDLLGQLADGQLCGIQCKLRNADQVLSEREVRKEVEKAKSFSPPLGKFILATTARRDPVVQRLAVEISRSHLTDGLFSVHVYSWDDLKELIKLSPQLASDLYGVGEVAKVLGEAQVAVAEASVIDLRSDGVADFQEDLDQAFKYVRQGSPEVTVELLEALRKKRWDQLSPRQRYRVLANIGNAWLAAQDKPRAAKAYLEAAAHQPRDEDARAFEALSYLLVDDREKAFEFAQALCRDHPALPRAHMIRIRCSPPELSLEELKTDLPPQLSGQPEVALALHDRALAEGRVEEAERILREDLRDDHGWVQLTLALGSTLLQQEFEAMHVGIDGPILADRERVVEARDLFSQALEQIPEGDPEQLSVGAYLNRGTCRRLLGEHEAARDDFRVAYQLAPNNEKVAIALARSVVPGKADINQAIGVLEDFLKEQESKLVELLLAELLRQREQDGDLQRAVRILESHLPGLADLDDQDLKADTVEILADLYVRTGQGEKALDFLDEVVEAQLSTAAVNAVRGNVLLRAAKTERALEHAQLAQQSLAEDADWNDVRRTALLLERLEEYSDAYALWRRLVSAHSISAETSHLLRCARAAGEHEFVIDFCEQVRLNGHVDLRSISHEIEVLLQYSEFNKARNVFLEYLAANPDDKVVRLHLTTLAIRLNWSDLVGNDPSDLPTIEEVPSADLGAEIVNVLRVGPNPTLAVDFAYRLYRKFPDEVAANMALVASVMQPGDAGLSIEAKLRTVQSGAAVRWIDLDSNESSWLVIEDAPDAQMARGEYTSSHALVRAMLDRMEGEEFLMPEGGIRERRGRIAEIRDKRVFRAQESMLRWTQRFPEQSFVESVPIGGGSEGPESTDDLNEVAEVMRRTSESLQRLEVLYRGGAIPTSALANFRGRSVFDTVCYLAGRPGLPIRAARGAPANFQEAKIALDNASEVLLGPTSVATLALLEETAILDELPFRCHVNESCLQELRDELILDSVARRAHGYMGWDRGRLVVEEVTEESKTARIDWIEGLLGSLEDKCEVLGGGGLARVGKEKRNMMREVLARSSAESVATASRRGMMMWTDDHLLVELVKADLPLSRVWTQSVFLWAANAGLVDGKRLSRLAASLLRFGYAFTSLSSETVLHTCSEAEWRTDDQTLAAVLGEFGNEGWDFETGLNLVLGSIGEIWRHAPLVEQASGVTTHILVALVSRTDGWNLIRLLHENVDKLLGLNVARAEVLKELLRTFIKSGGAPVGGM